MLMDLKRFHLVSIVTETECLVDFTDNDLQQVAMVVNEHLVNALSSSSL